MIPTRVGIIPARPKSKAAAHGSPPGDSAADNAERALAGRQRVGPAAAAGELWAVPADSQGRFAGVRNLGVAVVAGGVVKNQPLIPASGTRAIARVGFGFFQPAAVVRLYDAP